MTILEKIRSLPEGRKKIIFWSILIVVGLGLTIIFVINVQRNIRNFKSINLTEELKLPDLSEELKNMPSLEISSTTEADLKKLEEEIQKNEEENQTSTLEQQATTTE